MDKLDLTKPHGTVYGEPRFAYEQDGIYYGPDGSVIEKWSTPEKIAGERALALKRKQREETIALRREERDKRRRALEEL